MWAGARYMHLACLSMHMCWSANWGSCDVWVHVTVCKGFVCFWYVYLDGCMDYFTGTHNTI